jgi:O-succinylbenzoate synthase
VRRRMAAAHNVALKLDATSEWTDELIAELVALDRVDSIDLKGAYHGTTVDQPADPDLYRRVVDAFPHAWIEDPALTPETDAILAPHRDRITWDAVIHTVADVEKLPFPPKVINVKPSRSGSLETLFGLYDHLEAHGIGAYGGGQTELSVGRGHIQTLAAHFHPDSSNDVAPREFNLPETPAQLPSSPLELDLSQPGFGPR